MKKLSKTEVLKVLEKTAKHFEKHPKTFGFFVNEIPQTAKDCGCLVGHALRIAGVKEISDSLEYTANKVLGFNWGSITNAEIELDKFGNNPSERLRNMKKYLEEIVS